MSPKPDNPARLFDRFLIALTVMGALIALIALVGVMRGPATVVGGEQTTLDVVLSEFSIKGNLVAAPGKVELKVRNGGSVTHNLMLEGGPSTSDLNSEDTAILNLGDLGEGTYTLFCHIAGHREAGMEAKLVVGGEASAHTEHDMSPAKMDEVMFQSMLAFPAETKGLGNQLLQPTLLADGTKQFELTAAVTPWEVEPGKWVEAWTYNGSVPGPMIKVDIGDRVRVVVTNNLELSTDIHWHGIHTPNNQDGVSPYTQEPIRPGESFTYEFEAVDPAIGMYHAHLHAQEAIPNGMFAVFQIGDTPLPAGRTVSGLEIPVDLEVAREIPMVLNDAGVIGLSLNGKSFPATEPYVVKKGDWVVYHYYNEGLQIHPMHQHQFPQLVFAKDGFPLDQPYWADTVAVAPGERYSVLVHAEDPGVWVWHCHIITHAERSEGMFGMVTALIVEDA